MTDRMFRRISERVHITSEVLRLYTKPCFVSAHRMEVSMRYRFSIVTTAALLLGGVTASAAELPTYEVMGFPITPHQLVAIGSANVRERSPTPTLTVGGMPASPHQIKVLTPRPSMTVASGH
jgi:hypothetical protein